MHTHIHTHTHTHVHACTHSRTYPRSETHAHTHTHTNTFSNSLLLPSAGGVLNCLKLRPEKPHCVPWGKAIPCVYRAAHDAGSRIHTALFTARKMGVSRVQSCAIISSVLGVSVSVCVCVCVGVCLCVHVCPVSNMRGFSG